MGRWLVWVGPEVDGWGHKQKLRQGFENIMGEAVGTRAPIDKIRLLGSRRYTTLSLSYLIRINLYLSIYLSFLSIYLSLSIVGLRQDKIVGFHDATRLTTLRNSTMPGPLTPRHKGTVYWR